MPKQNKSAVGYHLTQGRDRCSACTHYDGHGGCNRVVGRVAPNGWCKLFHRLKRTNPFRHYT